MPVLFGSPPCQVWKVVKFHVISASSSFNAILGRTTITALKAITSISHLKMKFPTNFGIGEMMGDQTTARQCYLTTVSPRKKGEEDLEVNQVLEIDPRNSIESTNQNSCFPAEETEEIEVVISNPSKITKDMPGIPEVVARHSLHINKNVVPIRQKRRIFSDEKRTAIEQEIDRLLEAKFIEPVQFPTWISNVILVKKHNGKWRMCVDYSDVNKACPKDFYPLPNID
ncbi:uncharacterized protein LOC141680454 [Apium graveolens]|uniref:uncharacterized protein LOC141680454 n=1 Tax=Apium graveolens TaxID=4045 RepID=UPI003D79A9D5